MELVNAGLVTVHGVAAKKPATAVSSDAPVVVKDADTGPQWASRGASKLIGALDRFGTAGLDVTGLRCLDAGASTGGFTDVLLHRGAREVVAVDVGYGQLVWRLQSDERVRIHDRTNVRALTPDLIGGPVELTVADLSFISLKLVLPALAACTMPGGSLLPMVKPQFEVGRERLGSGGVVRDPELRMSVVLEVIEAAAEIGLGLQDVVASPLPGPAGNVEYFLWLRSGTAGPDDPGQLVRDAVEDGPK